MTNIKKRPVLNRNEFVVISKEDSKSFLKYESGEIVIYDNLKHAHEDSKIFNGYSIRAINLENIRQEILLSNIRRFNGK